jgi:tRNA (adenine57-N1/adenine58-N1)-methyltransferase
VIPPLAAGDSVLLIDNKGRRYLLRLQPGSQFHYHLGVVPHDLLIGGVEGTQVLSSGGGVLAAYRPRLADYILKMPRGAAVVYPKDIGSIAVYADIAPGMTVLEGGTGSGALALALLRFVGPTGRVVSVERREDHLAHARKIISRWHGGEIPTNLELRLGEIEEAVADVIPDRLVLDVPEPWSIVPAAGRHLPGGALLCSYLPTVPQLQALTDALRESQLFSEIEIFETLFRTWTVEGRSVRPDHRMVGHTGFLVVARKLAGLDRGQALDRERVDPLG